MKKKILVALAAIAAGLFVFTGCQKEKPFSIYQIGADYANLPFKGYDENGQKIQYTQAEIEALPADQKDIFTVAKFLDTYLVNSAFVMNGTLGNPIVIEGADEAYNDASATEIYKNKLNDLKSKNLDQIVLDAQKKIGANGQPEISVTTTGVVQFNYAMWKGSAVSLMPGCSFWMTVSYGPLNSNPQ